MKTLMFFFLFFFPYLVFAQDAAPAMGISDIALGVLDLFKKDPSRNSLVVVSSALMLTMQIMKMEMLAPLMSKLGIGMKRLITVVLGQIYAVVLMVSSGMAWDEAMISGLLVSGGATAMFQAWKGVKGVVVKKPPK